MSSRVQSFIVKAHPANSHPKYCRWQTATLCLFVGDDNKQRAFSTAKKTVSKHHWVPFSAFEKATLIEDRVRSFGGAAWHAYQEALQGKIRLVEIIDQPTAGKDGSMPILAPKVTEAFIDSVVTRAGGHRFVPVGPKGSLPRNADYIIDDYVFDLKTLEEESLEIVATQDKLASLFRSAFPDMPSIALDPAQLPFDLQRQYLDIVHKRIQRLVHSASGQVRETKKQLGNESLKGGVILLNSGFGSLLPSVLEDQAERCVKQSSQVDCAICVTVWLLTNGFDSVINFKVYPELSQNKTVKKVTTAFLEREDAWMTEWGRSGFALPSEVIDPMKPVAFERDGIIFSFLPPQLPDERFSD